MRPLVAMLVLVGAWLQATAVAQEPLTPDAAVALAVERSPTVAAATTRLEIERGARARARLLLGNPQANASFDPRGGFLQVQAYQPFSVSGEGWLARAAAKAGLEAAEASVERARFEAAAEARRAWAAAASARVRVDVAERAVALSRRLAEGVHRRYVAGEASKLDERLARLTAAEAEVRLQEALAEGARALQRLASVVQQPVDDDDVPADPLRAAPAVSGVVAETRSDVLAARSGLDEAERELARARAAAVPPLWIGAFVEKTEGETFVGPYLQWDLPLFDRNQERRGEALGQRGEAEVQVRSTEARAEVEVTTARRRVAHADEALAGTGADLNDEAAAALADVSAAVEAGELDLAGAILLRQQILAAIDALARLDLVVAEARIDLLLALEDPALLGERAGP